MDGGEGEEERRRGGVVWARAFNSRTRTHCSTAQPRIEVISRSGQFHPHDPTCRYSASVCTITLTHQRFRHAVQQCTFFPSSSYHRPPSTSMSEPRSARLTFPQFRSYCQSYLSHRTPSISSAPLSWQTYAQGWEWLDPTLPGAVFEPSACLSRSFSLLAPPSTTLSSSEETEESHDDSSAEIQQHEAITVVQTIHWSKIWQLPVLYFHAHTASGQPLSLEQLVSAGVVRKLSTLPTEEDGGMGGISVADHPRTGLPSFYLHPCNTNDALTSLIHREGEGEGWEYVAAFISLCASAVEMRSS